MKYGKGLSMSKRELWEIVRADELQPDDVIRLDIYSHAIHVDRLIFGGGLVQIYPSKDSLSHRQPVLRRIPDADESRVLRRALDLAEKNSVVGDAFGRMCQGPSAEDYIDQARRELESEGRDDHS